MRSLNENNEGQHKALDLALSGHNFFLNGHAGTGKKLSFGRYTITYPARDMCRNITSVHAGAGET